MVCAVVRGEEVGQEVTRLEYQAAKSQRRYFLVKTFGDGPDGVFCGTVQPGCTRSPAMRGATGQFLILLLFVLTD